MSGVPPASSRSSSGQRRKNYRSQNAAMTVVGVAAAAYGVYKFANWAWSGNDKDEKNDENENITTSSWWWSSLVGNSGENEHMQQQDLSSVMDGRNRGKKQPLDPRTRFRLRRQRVQNCRKESFRAFTRIWPSAMKIIETSTNTSKETKALKELRKLQKNGGTGGSGGGDPTTVSGQKAEEEGLWIKIQTQAFTRLISSTYASSLLFLSLTVQFHLVGGVVFRDDDCDKASLQSVLMNTHDYYLETGLPLLLNIVTRVVEVVTSKWKPTQFLSKNDIDVALDKIQHILRYGNFNTSKFPRNWGRIIFPDDGVDNKNHTSASNRDNENTCLQGDGVIDMLWDIANSPVWEDAEYQILHATFHNLQTTGWGKAFFATGLDDNNEKENNNKNNENNENEIRIPLAKFIPSIKSCVSNLFGETIEEINLYRKIQTLPSILELGDISFQ